MTPQETPHGRVINRFSKDTSEVDRTVIRVLTGTIRALTSTLGSFLMVGVNAYLALLPFLPFVRVYVHLQGLFNRAVTEVWRLTKTTSSPVYDHFANLCRENGLSVVRAFHEVDIVL